MAEYGVDISVRVKRDQVDQLGRLLNQVEKQVGKLNRVKVSLDASPANRALDALNNRLREAEQLANRFSGSNKIRAGIGAFSSSVGGLSKELAAVRTSFDQAKTATDRQARALELLSGQFKKTRLEGQAFANASADFFDKGLGSLNERLKEIEKLPRNLFSSGEAIRELTYLQSLAVQGTEEWLTVSKALGQQLAINANIRLGAQRAQGPMPQDPFGTRQLLLPAAGQSSGTFAIVERQAKLEGSLEQSVTRRAKVEARVAELKELEAEQAERLNRSELASIQNRTKAYQQDRKARAEGLRSGIGSAVIGGAFPLLFGQGVGASLGGAIGGGVGARFGGQGGFGGSLVGTFAGQATIDFAINSAVQLGTALRKPTDNIKELTRFLGIAGTQLDANIEILQSLGYTSTASAIALAKLEEVLQAEGYKNVNTLSKQLTDLENAFSRLKLATATLVAAPLAGFFDDLADFIKLIARLGGVQGLITTPPETIRQLDKEIQAERRTANRARGQENSAAEQAAQKIITQELNRQVQLAGAQASLEKDRLYLTRTGLAARQGDIELLRISNELDKKSVELAAAKNQQGKARRQQLEQEVELLKKQQAQAEAARQNAVIEAQRQLTRELNGLEIQKLGVSNDINRLIVERVALQNGELAGIKASRNNLQEELNDRAYALKLQRDISLIGVNDLAVREEIHQLYNGQLKQLVIEINNRKMSLDQQEAAYNLTQLQIKQQRELNNLQIRSQYAMQLRTLEAQRDPRFMGPFGGPQRTQELMTLEAQTTLFNMRSQLAALQSQFAVPGLSEDKKLEIEQESKALADQISLYQQYQPAIINATVAQERFNEAMGFTRPVVDGVFESIIAVAESTKTAEQAFADFLQGIASMLFDIGRQIIAQYIAIGIARKFAGIPGIGGGLEPKTDVGNAAFMDRVFGLDLAGRAAGGPVSAGTPYLVGERGPELFMPRTSGSIYPNDAMGMGGANIVVNVDAGGSSVGGDPGQANQLGKAIGIAVQQELIKQKRPGGLLA